MSSTDPKALIVRAVERLHEEVPALAPLKLVVELELRGRGDVQLYRVEVPGPKITKEDAGDAKVRLSLPRSHFNELAAEGRVKNWHDAFDAGIAKASGPPEILKLIAAVVGKQQARASLRRARQH